MKRLFGTDGIRDTVGTGIFIPNRLYNLGLAFGQWIIDTYGNNAAILIGSDTRESAQMIIAALSDGITRFPITLYTAGIIPTPAATLLMQKDPTLCFSIIISASHNPASDNGIKCICASTGKLSDDQEHTIERYFHQISSMQQSYTIRSGRVVPYPHAAEQYTKAIQELVPPFQFPKKRVVLDMAHGATSGIAPELFRAYNIDIIPIHNHPDGTNINKDAGAVYPQTLCKAVQEHTADIGLSFDGDGDRIIAATRSGIYKDGDDILCLLLNHSRYANNKSVIGTIMTNGGLERYLGQRSIKLLRTAVGDRHIIPLLKAKQSTLGGEPAGHIILSDFLMTGDSILTALVLLEAIAQTDNWSMETFNKQPQISMTIPVTRQYDLTAEPFKEMIERATKTMHTTRIVIRYSGTEPLLRIMTESESYDLAYYAADTIAQQLDYHHKTLELS